jgi:DoxX-like family
MSTTGHPVMQAASSSGSISMKSVWAGRIISGLITAFMIFDGVMHIMRPAPVVEAFAKLNFPLSFAVPLGIIELACVAFYVIPSTSILGAILLTGYLGGAVAIQLPTGNPFFGEILFPVYIGVFLWGGIYLRDARLRTLIPFQR